MTKPKRLPIENQLRAYLNWSKNIKQVTMSTYINKTVMLKRFVKEIGLEDIIELSNKTFDKWVQKRIMKKCNTGRQYNINSVRTEIAVIVAWLEWLKDMDYKLKIKTRMIIKPKAIPSRRKWYTSNDIAKVLDHCEDLIDEVMIRVLFDTGLRAREFINLKLSDIDNRTIYVFGKGRKQGWVYISEYTRERLNLWVQVMHIKDYIWIKGTRRDYYGQMSVDGIRKRLKAVFKRAGFDDFQMHEMRHSFATDLRNKGADMDVIQKLMRHSSLQVTQHYLHNLEGDLCPVWDKVKNYQISPNHHSQTVYIRGEMISV
nr:MAG TPA: SITE SPECIFIC RECOMBINASE XERD [Caudoviricetes sp.]